jgi:hypothetical protein
MGFFSNCKNVGKINVLLKQIEAKVNAIEYEAGSSYPNTNRMRVEVASISLLMNEIMEIASNSGNSVLLAPYYFFGKKSSLFQIASLLAAFTNECEACL